jgi:hypothetical protein
MPVTGHREYEVIRTNPIEVGRSGTWCSNQDRPRLSTPNDDHWFVAVDLGGNTGTINASVGVEPPPRGSLSPIRNSGQLSAIRHQVPDEPPTPDVLGGRTWDVFISHASEDKESIARPLQRRSKSWVCLSG